MTMIGRAEPNNFVVNIAFYFALLCFVVLITLVHLAAPRGDRCRASTMEGHFSRERFLQGSGLSQLHSSSSSECVTRR